MPVVTLPSAWIVEVGDQRIDVPAQSFRRALENARRNPSTWPAQRSRILAQLGAMQDEARAFAARSSVRAGSNPADSRDTLNAILSGAEFRQLRQESALSRLRQRAAEWLLDVWDGLGGSMLGCRGTAIAFAWIAVLVTLGMLTSWLMRVILRSSQEERFGSYSGAIEGTLGPCVGA